MTERMILVMCSAVCAAMALFILSSPYLPEEWPETDNTAATVRAAKTTQGLYARYENQQGKRLSILVVPGHEPNYGGTEYKDLLERDIVVDIADELAERLRANRSISVMVARTKTGWHPTLQHYFDTNWDRIVAWRDSNKVETARLEASGLREEVVPAVRHNPAPEGPSVRLNGINKWADENDVDVVLHLHINDHPRSRASEPGTYSGFALYIPYPGYANNDVSRAIAEKLYDRLARYYPVSDLPGESAGIVEEAKLIAIGRDNSQSAASMLVEYGYIYEPQWTEDALRQTTVHDVAMQTYLGLQDFFDRSSQKTYTSTLLPYTWERTVGTDTDTSLDIVALQTALVEEGVYPPPGNTLNECPRSGKFGPCTERALKLFQKKYGIEGDGTILGPATRTELNARYGKQLSYQ